MYNIVSDAKIGFAFQTINIKNIKYIQKHKLVLLKYKKDIFLVVEFGFTILTNGYAQKS